MKKNISKLFLVVALLFGLMVFMPFFEVFYQQGYSRNLSYLIAFLFIGAVSAWYEGLRFEQR